MDEDFWIQRRPVNVNAPWHEEGERTFSLGKLLESASEKAGRGNLRQENSHNSDAYFASLQGAENWRALFLGASEQEMELQKKTAGIGAAAAGVSASSSSALSGAAGTAKAKINVRSSSSGQKNDTSKKDMKNNESHQSSASVSASSSSTSTSLAVVEKGAVRHMRQSFYENDRLQHQMDSLETALMNGGTVHSDHIFVDDQILFSRDAATPWKVNGVPLPAEDIVLRHYELPLHKALFVEERRIAPVYFSLRLQVLSVLRRQRTRPEKWGTGTSKAANTKALKGLYWQVRKWVEDASVEEEAATKFGAAGSSTTSTDLKTQLREYFKMAKDELTWQMKTKILAADENPLDWDFKIVNHYLDSSMLDPSEILAADQHQGGQASSTSATSSTEQDPLAGDRKFLRHNCWLERIPMNINKVDSRARNQVLDDNIAIYDERYGIDLLFSIAPSNSCYRRHHGVEDAESLIKRNLQNVLTKKVFPAFNHAGYVVDEEEEEDGAVGGHKHGHQGGPSRAPGSQKSTSINMNIKQGVDASTSTSTRNQHSKIGDVLGDMLARLGTQTKDAQQRMNPDVTLKWSVAPPRVRGFRGEEEETLAAKPSMPLPGAFDENAGREDEDEDSHANTSKDGGTRGGGGGAGGVGENHLSPEQEKWDLKPWPARMLHLQPGAFTDDDFLRSFDGSHRSRAMPVILVDPEHDTKDIRRNKVCRLLQGGAACEDDDININMVAGGAVNYYRPGDAPKCMFAVMEKSLRFVSVSRLVFITNQEAARFIALLNTLQPGVRECSSAREAFTNTKLGSRAIVLPTTLRDLAFDVKKPSDEPGLAWLQDSAERAIHEAVFENEPSVRSDMISFSAPGAETEKSFSDINMGPPKTTSTSSIFMMRNVWVIDVHGHAIAGTKCWRNSLRYPTFKLSQTNEQKLSDFLNHVRGQRPLMSAEHIFSVRPSLAELYFNRADALRANLLSQGLVMKRSIEFIRASVNEWQSYAKGDLGEDTAGDAALQSIDLKLQCEARPVLEQVSSAGGSDKDQKAKNVVAGNSSGEDEQSHNRDIKNVNKVRVPQSDVDYLRSLLRGDFTTRRLHEIVNSYLSTFSTGSSSKRLKAIDEGDEERQQNNDSAGELIDDGSATATAGEKILKVEGQMTTGPSSKGFLMPKKNDEEKTIPITGKKVPNTATTSAASVGVSSSSRIGVDKETLALRLAQFETWVTRHNLQSLVSKESSMSAQLFLVNGRPLKYTNLPAFLEALERSDAESAGICVRDNKNVKKQEKAGSTKKREMKNDVGNLNKLANNSSASTSISEDQDSFSLTLRFRVPVYARSGIGRKKDVIYAILKENSLVFRAAAEKAESEKRAIENVEKLMLEVLSQSHAGDAGNSGLVSEREEDNSNSILKSSLTQELLNLFALEQDRLEEAARVVALKSPQRGSSSGLVEYASQGAMSQVLDLTGEGGQRRTSAGGGNAKNKSGLGRLSPSELHHMNRSGVNAACIGRKMKLSSNGSGQLGTSGPGTSLGNSPDTTRDLSAHQSTDDACQISPADARVIFIHLSILMEYHMGLEGQVLNTSLRASERNFRTQLLKRNKAALKSIAQLRETNAGRLGGA